MKERLNYIGRDIHDEETEDQKEPPHPDPPVCRAQLDDPEAGTHKNPGDHGRDEKGFEEISDPEPGGHRVEIVFIFDPEGAVEAEGNGKERACSAQDKEEDEPLEDESQVELVKPRVVDIQEPPEEKEYGHHIAGQ